MKKVLFLLLLALSGQIAAAGPILDRVKAEQRVHCGAAERPGIIAESGGIWSGIAVDVCRAVATAVLGAPDKVEIAYYESDQQFARAVNGEDDLAFLTGSEIHLQNYAGRVLPGPAIFYETHKVIVHNDNKAQSLEDLASKKICFSSGSRVERSVSDYYHEHKLQFLPNPFTEEGEMLDGYKARICDALAHESTTIAEILGNGGDSSSHILPVTVVTFPIMAVTATKDAEWAAIVAWTVDTLIAGERRETYWYAGGAQAMPVTAPELGLDRQWQNRVLAATGDYGAIYERHFGAKSGHVLARGPNENQANGGLLLAPFRE